MLGLSSSSQADQQAATIKELTAKISELTSQVEKLNARIDHLNEVIQMKDEVIKAKNREIKNLKNEVANGRRHRFGPTTEQRNLLNNRPTDTEGERKQDFDGTPESLLDFVQILQEELVRAGVLPTGFDFEAHKQLVPMQPGDVPTTYADATALERDFGFTLKITLREGLRKFAEWYKCYYRSDV